MGSAFSLVKESCHSFSCIAAGGFIGLRSILGLFKNNWLKKITESQRLMLYMVWGRDGKSLDKAGILM